MPKIEIEPGIELFYEELGSGENYLICTQVRHSRYTPERAMADRGFHVFLLTNRGFGRSSHITDDYGDYWYDRFADDVILFADKMGIGKFVYSGSSHGAGAGWHVALKYPDRLHCFFAIVPGPHNLDEGRGSMRSQALQGKLVNHCFRYPTDDPRLNERRRLEDEAAAAEKALPDYTEVFDAPETRAIDYGRPLRALRTEEKVQEALRTIRIPVLIMGGMEDTISRPDLMIRSAKCLPCCKLIIHSSFGHSLDICEELAEDAYRFYGNLQKTGYYYSEVNN